MTSAGVPERNRLAIAQFRARGGTLDGPFAGIPVLLLHTTEPQSGSVRVHPLTCRPRAADWLVVASDSGADTHPSWFANLVVEPRVIVETGSHLVPAYARVARGSERDVLWAELTAENPRFADYESMTSRVIPVVVLRPR